MLLKLKVFKYATSLDLNMGYYNIQRREGTGNLCTIILIWGGYWYKNLHGVIINLPRIFKQKMNDILQGFDFIHKFIFKIFDYNEKQMEISFRETGTRPY